MTDAMARMLSGHLPWGSGPAPPAAMGAPDPEPAATRDDVADLRRELDELKRALKDK